MVPPGLEMIARVRIVVVQHRTRYISTLGIRAPHFVHFSRARAFSNSAPYPVASTLPALLRRDSRIALALHDHAVTVGQ
jgi:hypothetical protein